MKMTLPCSAAHTVTGSEKNAGSAGGFWNPHQVASRRDSLQSNLSRVPAPVGRRHPTRLVSYRRDGYTAEPLGEQGTQA